MLRTETIIVPVSSGDSEEKQWTARDVEVATFQEIPEELTTRLLAWLRTGHKVGESVTIDGTEHVLDFVSENKNSRFNSRGLSIYFRTKRSIIRISDHWSESNGHPRSRKLNCGRISDCYWVINNSSDQKLLDYTWHAGKYPWKLLAGKAGLVQLNKTAPHWKAKK